jgi:hypothetical protein
VIAHFHDLQLSFDLIIVPILLQTQFELLNFRCLRKQDERMLLGFNREIPSSEPPSKSLLFSCLQLPLLGTFLAVETPKREKVAPSHTRVPLFGLPAS